MKNSVIIGKELEILRNDLSSNIDNFKKSIDNNELSLVTTSMVLPLGWTDGFRLFFEGLKNYSSPMKSMILSSIYSINKTCPLALPLYFDVLMGKDIPEPNRGFRIGSKALIKDIRSLKDDFISTHYTTLIKALNTAGAGSTISIESHNEINDAVEVTSGFKTLCRINSFFEPYFSTQEIENAKIVVIDGSVIEVSEIHHILEESYNAKKTFVVIARHFSDDVSNTLFVNWQSGKTNVIPFYISDSLESINEIKDICTLTKTIPVSKDTGIRVSSIDVNECAQVGMRYDAKAQCLRILLDFEGVKKADICRKKLQDQFDKENIDDVKILLSKRISRMTSRNVTIKLNYSSLELGLVQDRAAAFFQYFSKCAEQGVTVLDNDYSIKYLPVNEVVNSIRKAKYDKEAIKNIKAVLRIEQQ